MRSVELHRAFDYTKNVVSHVVGIPAYQKAREDFRRDSNDSFARIAALGGIYAEIVGPITTRATDKNLSGQSEQYEITKLTGGFVIDVASLMASGYLIATGRVAEGVGLKAAYNAATVVTPDVLKSMKNTLGKIKGQPPTTALV